jgi:FkbM family methyltransferase
MAHRTTSTAAGSKKAETLRAKLAVAATMCGMTPAATAELLGERAIAAMPNVPFDPSFRDLDVKECRRIGDDLMRIDLTRGRTFFGPRSERKEYLFHHLLKRFVPESISADAFKLAMDINTRYLRGTPPPFIGKGSVLIEGGCYTGLKAMQWHDTFGGDCRIVAVEIGQSNFELMRMNVAANGMGKAIMPVHAGLWRESGTGTQRHNFTTRRFLEATDRWEGDMVESEDVRLTTIDDLLDASEIDVADYLNIQVNGAEIEVLKGLTQLDRVKSIGVAAYYAKGESRNADVVRSMILAQGCTIVYDVNGRIEYVTPRHRAEMLERIRVHGLWSTTERPIA